jgi:uncharacterized protein YjbI with pentapeptide repeats
VEPEKTSRTRAEDLLSLLVSDWRPTPRQSLWAIRLGIVLSLLVAIGYSYGITLWDWIKLLVVPAAIAAAGLWFNRQQQERQRADDWRQQERALDIADQRAQDDALQAYLDQMSLMLTNKERPLRRAQPGDDLSVVARARTLTVLTKLEKKRKLDKDRKGSVLQFLYESGLITKDRRILDLSKADLFMADLYWAKLSEANLHGVYLIKANLIQADLVKADLSGAYLIEADLIRADLSEANLSNAWLRHANLSSATGLTDEQITAARTLEGPPCLTAKSTRTGSRTKRAAERMRSNGSQPTSEKPDKAKFVFWAFSEVRSGPPQ